jgi:hypothetical protein
LDLVPRLNLSRRLFLSGLGLRPNLSRRLFLSGRLHPDFLLYLSPR